MATIDIRDATVSEIDIIKFSDRENESDGCKLRKGWFVSIDTELEDKCVFIDTIEDAKNLIKALQKAIELGWWE